MLGLHEDVTGPWASNCAYQHLEPSESQPEILVELGHSYYWCLLDAIARVSRILFDRLIVNFMQGCHFSPIESCRTA